MPSNFLPILATWAALAMVVLALAIRRWSIARREDDVIHIHGDDEALIQQQTMVARQLTTVDRWGISLTIVLVVYAFALIAWAMYIGWVNSASLPVS